MSDLETACSKRWPGRLAAGTSAAIACAALAAALDAYLALYLSLDGEQLSLDLVLHRAPSAVCSMLRMCSA